MMEENEEAKVSNDCLLGIGRYGALYQMMHHGDFGSSSQEDSCCSSSLMSKVIRFLDFSDEEESSGVGVGR